jgi:hypothetical protein
MPSALRGDLRRARSVVAPTLPPWAFAVLPFLGRFRAVRDVGGVFVRAWRFVRPYAVIFEPWRVLRCALCVPLPFSRDFSPLLARFAVGVI